MGVLFYGALSGIVFVLLLQWFVATIRQWYEYYRDGYKIYCEKESLKKTVAELQAEIKRLKGNPYR